MSELSYKLLALDLDGTLIGRTLTLSARVKAALREASEAGLKATLCTGRMFKSALPFAQELDLTTPIICYQGAMIADPVSKKILWHQPIPLPLAWRAIVALKEKGLHFNVYIDDELYVEEMNGYVERYARISRVEAHIVGDLLNFLEKEPTKIVVICDESMTDGLVEDLKARFDSELNIVKSYPIFCEISHPDCSKSRALHYLATLLGITQAETIAVGDNPNDLDMIQWAGLGIAMANAAPEVIAAADGVTGSIEDDGVAQVIGRLLAKR